MEGQLDLARLRSPISARAPRPEDLSEDRCVLEQALALRRQGVEDEPRSAPALVRHLHRIPELAALGEEPHELLRVQGIATRALDQDQLHVRWKLRALEQRQDERAVSSSSAHQVDPLRVPRLAPKPGSRSMSSAWRYRRGAAGRPRPSRPGARGRRARDSCPVQILEDEDVPGLRPARARDARRERLLLRGGHPSADEAEAPPSGRRRRERPLAAPARASPPRPRASPSKIPACAFTISPSAQKVMPSPYGRHRPCRQVMSSGRSSMYANSSAQRRLFPAPGSPTSVTSCSWALRAHRSKRLVRRARSATRPTNGESMGADQVGAEASPRLDGAIQRHRLGLSFQRDRRQRLVLEDPFRLAERLLRDGDAVDRRRALDSSCRVHHVACNESLAELGPRPEGHERLASVDADSHAQAERRVVRVQLGQIVEDAQPRTNRALRIVLVRDRSAEDGHHRVSDELLDRPAEVLDVRAQALVIRADPCANVLGVDVSEAAVKPTRSQKRTETTLRSSWSEGAGRSASGAPQNGQKGNSPGSSLPQEGQVGTSQVSGALEAESRPKIRLACCGLRPRLSTRQCHASLSDQAPERRHIFHTAVPGGSRS